MCPTQRSIQLLLDFFPGVKKVGGVNLTRHLYLVPLLRLRASMAWTRKNVSLNLFLKDILSKQLRHEKKKAM